MFTNSLCSVSCVSLLSSTTLLCSACMKVKITTLLSQQPYDLEPLVKAMDGEVSPQYSTSFEKSQVFRQLPVYFDTSNDDDNDYATDV